MAATDDSLTLAWNASTDNSGSIHHYVRPPGSLASGEQHDEDDHGPVPSCTQTYRVSRGRRGGQRVAAERAADRDHAAAT